LNPLAADDGTDGLGAESPAVGEAAMMPEKYFDLYNLAVEMADRTSARRGVANSFFLTVNTGVLALLGTVNSRWYPAAAGILLCVTWWALLKSYRDLNRAKFAVILAMEEQLPARVFGDEWDHLRKDRVIFAFRRTALLQWLTQYRELGYVERVVPWIFALIYVAEIAQSAAR
jgi:hypothetical protein